MKSQRARKAGSDRIRSLAIEWAKAHCRMVERVFASQDNRRPERRATLADDREATRSIESAKRQKLMTACIRELGKSGVRVERANGNRKKGKH